MDQQVMAYYKNRRLRWHIKVMVHFFYIALNNAHISYRELNNLTIKECPFLDFIMEVICDLAPPKPTPMRPEVGIHTPIERGMEPKECKTKKDHRRACYVCKKKTGTRCKECDVFLHINTELTGKTCWSQHHKCSFEDA